MKSKGAVRFFAIALAVVCLFQLSFTFVANYWDRKADTYANKVAISQSPSNIARKNAIYDSARIHYTDSLSRQPVYNILVYKYNYLDVKERELNLGLDLRGGMHVTLEVAEDKLLSQLADTNSNPVFVKALAQ